MEKDTNLNDHELIYMVRQNDEEAFRLMKKKYELLIYRISNDLLRKYPYAYCANDDLVQEGTIALNNAIYHYKEDVKAKFITFAYLVIYRHLNNYLKAQSKTYAYEQSFDDLAVQESVSNYSHHSYAENPSTIFFNNYESELLKKAYNLLDDEDKTLIKYKLCGKSYVEIAAMCGITRKQVDNRLQKIKKYLIDYVR